MFSTLTGGSVNLLANTSSSTASSNIFTDYIIDPLGNVFYNIFDFSGYVVPTNTNTVTKVPPTPEPVFEPPVIETPPAPTETTTTTPVTNQYFNTYTTPATSVSSGERGPQGPTGPRGPQGPAGADADTSNFVDSSLFEKQVDGIFDSISDSLSGLSESIGEEVQTALLSVSGGTDLSGSVVIGSALFGTDKALTVNNNTSTGNIFEAQDGGSAVFTIADGGNVGIGTTTPNNLIQVQDLINFSNADYKTLLGYQAGKYDLGQYSTYLGYQSGSSDNDTNKTNAADYNTGIGSFSLYSNTTGFGNSANGSYALHLNTSGSRNTANGYQALYSNLTGSVNTAIGYQALYNNNTSYATAIGHQALYNNTTGLFNTASGYHALYSNTTGTYNTASGLYAQRYGTTGSYNNANGVQALQYNVTGSGNTADGSTAFFGLGAAATAGGFNVGTSYTILTVGTTDFTLIGASANTVGVVFTATGAGTGTGTAGPNANNNTALGYNTGGGLVYGSGNTILGANVSGLAAGLTNNIIIADGSGNKRINVDSNGLVGFGTTAPDKALEINSATGANMRLTYNDANGSAANYADLSTSSIGGLTITSAGTNPKTLVVNNGSSTGNIFEAQDGGTAVFRVADGGNVGIGNVAPRNLLTVFTGGSDGKISLIRHDTGSGEIGGVLKEVSTGFDERFEIGYDTGGSYTPRIRINERDTNLVLQPSGGNVGIGTTNGVVPRNLLTVFTGGATTDGKISLIRSGNASIEIGGVLKEVSTALAEGFEIGYDTGGSYIPRIRINERDTHLILQPSSGNVGIGTSAPADLLHVTTGNLRIGASTATRSTTAGTNQVVLFDGTAPVGTLTNGVSLYSTAGELRVLDAAGNETLLSPHENENNYWVFDSSNSETGKSIIIDMELMMKRLNDTFGWDFVHETIDGIDLDAEPSLELPDTFFGSITERIVAWFADASNGIGDLFADKVYTKELCVTKSDGEDFCVTGDQLEALVGSGGGSSGGSSGGSDEEPAPAPESEPLVPNEPVEGEPETIPTEGEPTTGEVPLESADPTEDPASNGINETDPVTAEGETPQDAVEPTPEETPAPGPAL
jgi:hypothetical protein